MSIAVVALFAVGLIVVMLTVALGRAAARGDADLEWRRRQAGESEGPQIEAGRPSDAGWAPERTTTVSEQPIAVPSAQVSIANEGSESVPLSSRSSSRTSRRPRVRLSVLALGRRPRS